MKVSRVLTIALTGAGAAAAISRGAKVLKEIGALGEEMSLGYSSDNALPIAGQAGFPDTSGAQMQSRAPAEPPAALYSQDA